MNGIKEMIYVYNERTKNYEGVCPCCFNIMHYPTWANNLWRCRNCEQLVGVPSNVIDLGGFY